jgi:hypothetical protein
MTSSRALLAYLTTVTLAVAGLAAAVGLPLSHATTHAIIQLETVLAPAIVLAVTWLHHNRARIVAAWYQAHATASAANAPPPPPPSG